MIGKVFPDPSRFVEPLYEAPYFPHKFVTCHASCGLQDTPAGSRGGSANGEAVSASEWSVQPREVIAKRSARLIPLADTEQLLIDADLERLHAPSIGLRTRAVGGGGAEGPAYAAQDPVCCNDRLKHAKPPPLSETQPVTRSCGLKRVISHQSAACASQVCVRLFDAEER